MLTIIHFCRAGNWRLPTAGAATAGALATAWALATAVSPGESFAASSAAPPAAPSAVSPGGQMTPSFWDPNRTPEKPDLSAVRQIRFMTEDDYPPFNFQTPDGQLAGFDVDLARAICAELGATCTIQRRGWDLLIPSLEKNDGDAVIAAVAINDETRKQADFTAPYFLTPGRFVLRRDSLLKDIAPETLGDRSVSVVAGSRHEAFLAAYYPKVTRVTFETPALARTALKAGRVQAHFGDAITLSYWLNGSEAVDCCEFRGGAFVDPRFFGDGLGVAVKKGNTSLRRALDYALARLARRGAMGELYLRYFPIGLY